MHRSTMFAVMILAAFGLSSCLSGAWRLVAGEPALPAAAPATAVALLDLNRVFSVHARFKRMTGALRQEVEVAERELKVAKADLESEANSLAALPKFSAEAKQAEAKIAQDHAAITAQVNLQKRQFFEREAFMYLEVYQEIMKEVAEYAKARGIGMVTRFSGEPYDSKDPQGIKKQLEKTILYQQGLDITDEIIGILNSAPAG